MHQNPFNPLALQIQNSNFKNLIQEIFCTRESVPFVSPLISEWWQFCSNPLALLLHVILMHVFALCGKHAGVEGARQRQRWGGGFKYRRELHPSGWNWCWIRWELCSLFNNFMYEWNKLHKIRLWLQLIEKMSENMMSLGWCLHAWTEGLTSRNLAVLQDVQSLFVHQLPPRRFSFNELHTATGSFSPSTFHNHQGEYYGFLVKLFNSYWVAVVSNSRVIWQGRCSLCFACKADYYGV